jgi:hypothetical protein
MSTTLYIALDPKVRGLNPNDADRVLLAQLACDEKRPTSIAKKLKVRPLGEFMSYDPQFMKGYFDDPAEFKAAMASARPVEWFDPSDALKTVRALAAHFEARPSDLPASVREHSDEVLEELKEVEGVLEKAAKKGAKFRWYVGE